MSNEARVEVKIWMPNGDRLRLRGYLDDLQVDRDIAEATSRHDALPTYLMGGSTFTLRGRTFDWKRKKENPWVFLSSRPESRFVSRSRRGGAGPATGRS